VGQIGSWWSRLGEGPCLWGERIRGMIFREALGIVNSAGAGSFAIDKFLIRHQAKSLGWGRLGLRVRGSGRGGPGDEMNLGSLG
jgi:hypothetical protein